MRGLQNDKRELQAMVKRKEVEIGQLKRKLAETESRAQPVRPRLRQASPEQPQVREDTPPRRMRDTPKARRAPAPPDVPTDMATADSFFSKWKKFERNDPARA